MKWKRPLSPKENLEELSFSFVFLAFLVYLCYIIIKLVIIIRIYFSVRYPASEDSVLFDFC